MSELLHFDAVVIGAGVVGLAAAKRLAESGAATVLLEGQAEFGRGISSRSSEVIHAGLYYPPGSLKARFCAPGNAKLYRYCAAQGVACRRLGKLIVAVTEAELPALDSYRRRARENGVDDLVRLDRSQLRELEPDLRAVAALFSPNTGIVDSHGLMAALLRDFESAGGMFVRSSPVLGGVVGDGATVLDVGGRDPCRITAALIVNSAGLGAQALAHALEGFQKHLVPPLHYAIGHYYGYARQVPFRHLVYPVAGGGGLGTHLTLDLGGQARFGPDISWRESEDYSFDESRQAGFYEAIRRYWPAVQADALVPGYTGIRPKLWGEARPEQDFMIQGPAEHGVAGLINLFGIESPGLTCALSIADHVAALAPGKA